MAKVSRKSKDFELRGYVQRVMTGKTKNNEPFVGLSVSGFFFFLPDELHAESNLLEEGQAIIVRGEYAGDGFRNGARQPNFDIYEIVPDGGDPLAAQGPTVHANGHVDIPRLSKAQPA